LGLHQKLKFAFYLGILTSLGCSHSVDAPSINSPIIQINTELCKNTDLNFRHLTSAGVRSLVNCLNGSNEALAPIKKLIDETADENLQAFLEIFNRHVIKNPSGDTQGTEVRLSQILDLVSRMRSDGSLDTMERSLSVLISSKSIERLLPLISIYIADPQNNSVVDSKFSASSGFIFKLLENKKMTKALSILARVFDSQNMRAAARKISVKTKDSTINSDTATDKIAEIFLSASQDHSIHKFLSHLTDAKALSGLSSLNDLELMAAARIFSFQSPKDQDIGQTINHFSQLVKGADQPLFCLREGNSFQKTDNILKFIAKELSERTPGDEINNFFLRELNFLFAATQDSCNFTSEIRDHKDVTTDVVEAGYGDGIRAIARVLYSSARISENADFLKSPYMVKIAPLLQELSRRNALYFLARALSKELSIADYTDMSEVLTILTSGDYRGENLTNWIKTSVSKNNRDEVLKLRADSKADSLSTLQTVTANLNRDDLMKALSQGISDHVDEYSPEVGSEFFLQKLMQPEHRGPLKDFMSSLVLSFSDETGGWGDLAGAAAQSAGLFNETPVQDVLLDTLKDKDLVNKISELFLSADKNQNLKSALDFTVNLYHSGELNRIIDFVIALLNQNSKNLSPPNSNDGRPFLFSQYSAAIEQNVPSSETKSVSTESLTNCRNIKGSIYDPDGKTLFNALKCLDGIHIGGAFSGIAEHLKEANLLPQAASLMKAVLQTSPLLHDSLNQAAEMVADRSLQKIIQTIGLAADPDHPFLKILEPVLAKALQNPNADQSIKLVGSLLRNWDFSKAMSGFLKASDLDIPKTFVSQNDFKLRVWDPQAMKAQISRLFPNYSSAQIDSTYLKAESSFISHDSQWKYVEGPYIDLNPADWTSKLTEFMQGILAPGILENLIKALSDISDAYDVPKFLKDAADSQRVAIHINRSGEWHAHIQSMLDQVETLLENSQLDIPGVGDAGVWFMKSVANSTNLPVQMNIEHEVLKVGFDAARFAGDDYKARALQNMLFNYQAVSELAKSGNLQIFQKIFKSSLSQLSSFRSLSDIGMFESLTVGIESLKEQGNLNLFINSLFGESHLISPEGVAWLRKDLESLKLNQVIDLITKANEDPTGYQNFKDSLFQFIPAFYSLKVDPKILFEILAQILSEPAIWDHAAKNIVSDLQKSKGLFLTTGLNISAMSEESRSSLSRILIKNDSEIVAATALLAQSFAKQGADFDLAIVAFQLWMNDERQKSLNLGSVLEKRFAEGSSKSGFGDLIGQTLLDDDLRASFIQVLRVFSEKGDLSLLADSLKDLANSPDLDRTLHFIFDNASLVSVGLK
jgi:hypothetical protein